MRDMLIGWVKQIFGTGLFSDVETILNMNPSTDFATVWKIVCTIYDTVCVPIGSGLVLIYFMINVLEKSTQQQSIDVEHIIKLLLKLFFGLYLIEHGLEIMGAIYSLSFGLVQGIIGVKADGKDPGAGIPAKVWKALANEDISKNVNWGGLQPLTKGVPILVELLIPWLAYLVTKIVVSFVCYTRLIEFYLKTAAAPIALSDFFTEGIHSNGWKFVKGYIAIALQAGIIMLAVVIYNAIASDIIGGFGDGYFAFLIKYLALGFATMGVLLKSLSLAKELVGVQ